MAESNTATMTSLDEVLGANNAPDEAAAPQQEPSQGVTAEPPPATPDPPRAASSSQPPDESQLPDDHMVPLRELRKERKKRQEEAAQRAEYERQLIETRARVSVYETRERAPHQSPQPQAQPQFDWADPKAYVDQSVGRVNEELHNRTLVLAEEVGRRTLPDFDKHFNAGVEALKSNPTLRMSVMSQPNPVFAAYDVGKTVEAQRELGATSIDEMRAKIREQVLAEVQSGAIKLPMQGRPAPAMPVLSSASAPGLGAASTRPTYAGPTPIDKILPGLGV